MSLPTKQHIWIVSNPPSAEIQSDTFTLETRDLPELKDGELLVQIEYISNDPAQRGWIQKDADAVGSVYHPANPSTAPMSRPSAPTRPCAQAP